MRIFLIAIVLFGAASARATYEFDPIAPTDRSFIHLQVREMWRDGCVPSTPSVTRNGNAIEVMWVVPKGVGCPLAFTEWNKEAPIGVLPAGVYAVVIKVDDWSGIRTLTTKKLIVTESAPAFTFDPRVVSTTASGDVKLTALQVFLPGTAVARHRSRRRGHSLARERVRAHGDAARSRARSRGRDGAIGRDRTFCAQRAPLRRSGGGSRVFAVRARARPDSLRRPGEHSAPNGRRKRRCSTHRAATCAFCRT